MQWLFDETGRRYLDMFAGIVTVSCGHSHPRVVKAIQDQAGKLQHTTTTPHGHFCEAERHTAMARTLVLELDVVIAER